MQEGKSPLELISEGPSSSLVLLLAGKSLRAPIRFQLAHATAEALLDAVCRDIENLRK